jgi:hypothetical protein
VSVSVRAPTVQMSEGGGEAGERVPQRDGHVGVQRIADAVEACVRLPGKIEDGDAHTHTHTQSLSLSLCVCACVFFTSVCTRILRSP